MGTNVVITENPVTRNSYNIRPSMKNMRELLHLVRGTVFLEKLTVAHLIKNLPTFCGT